MKKKFNLQDWLKDKSQKVETRSGKNVRIICWDKIGVPIVALVGDADDIVTYNRDGTTGQQMELPSDLFIVTPEPKLSEFEKAVGDIVKEAVEKEVGDNAAIWAIGRGHTEKLLALAREELMEELELDGRRSDAFYSGFKNGKKRGRAEALKDLPRWRHAFTTCSVEEMPKNSEYSYYSPDNKALIVLLENSNEAKCLMLDDLKKLPGFKEDEK